MINAYEAAKRLKGGADLNQQEIDALMAVERATRFVNIQRIEMGLQPIPVDVSKVVSPRPISTPPAHQPAPPATRWKSDNTVGPFDAVALARERVRAQVFEHVGKEWTEAVGAESKRRYFTETDAELICLAIRYQAGAYDQYARRLGIDAEAARRRIKMLERGGFVKTRVANPFTFRIASPSVTAMRLAGLRTRVFAGAESQLVHRLMVTELGLEYELAGDLVLSEYEIGVDQGRGLLFPSTTKPGEKTHRPDLVIRTVDRTTGEIRTISVEYERTLKRRKELSAAIWDTARSGRVDGVRYISPDTSILKIVDEFARINKIDAETESEYRVLPDWLKVSTI